MNRNIKLIFFTTGLFAFCVGLYDYILPFYLQSIGISFTNMGYIFAVGALLVLPVKIYSGILSDKLGRKGVIIGTLLCTSLANFGTPVLSGLNAQFVFKSLREIGFRILTVMYNVVLYENIKATGKRFKLFIARLDGMNLVLQSSGILFGGLILKWFSMKDVFIFNGIVLSILAVNFLFIFKEDRGESSSEENRLTFKKILRFEIPYALKIIAIASFIFRIGITISHCFILQIFFKEKFGFSLMAVSVILFIHRFSFGFPMFLFGKLIKRNFKFYFILTLIVEGIIIAVPMVLPVKLYIFATVLWLTHDIVGAAIWYPLRQTLIQRYARPESRGADVSIVFAVQEAGAIFGPVIAGYSMNITYSSKWLTITPFDALSAPFVLSGIFLILSALVILKLPYKDGTFPN